LVSEVVTIRAGTRDNEALRAYPLVVLEKSICLRGYGAPYYFQVNPVTDGGHMQSITYVGDLFFTPLKKQATTTFDRLFSEYGGSLMPVGLTNFYRCPLFGKDIGRIEATVQTIHYFEPAFNSVYTEANSLARLEEKFETTPQDDIAALIPHALMARNYSAGFERVINDIVDTEERFQTFLLLEEENPGLAIDSSAWFLFLARSGFMSLFMTYNPSVMGTQTQISIVRPDEKNDLRTHLLSWKKLRTTIPLERAIHDKRLFYFSHSEPEFFSSSD
jgi:hypothetical protein